MQKTTDVASAFQSVVSSSGGARELARLLANDHLTLQQDVMRFCLAYVQEMAQPKKYIDLRNQASVAMAKVIVEALGDKTGLPRI